MIRFALEVDHDRSRRAGALCYFTFENRQLNRGYHRPRANASIRQHNQINVARTHLLNLATDQRIVCDRRTSASPMSHERAAHDIVSDPRSSILNDPPSNCMSLETKARTGAPLPPLLTGERWIGNFRNFRQRRLAFFVETMLAHRKIARFRIGPRIVNLVSHPEGVRRVLQENQKNYDKQTPGMRNLRPLLGNGLLTSDGDFWLRQRRISQPAFHRAMISSFSDIMVRAAAALAETWQSLPNGSHIDLSKEMTHLTLRIVGETLLSTDVTGDADEVGPTVRRWLADASARLITPLNLPLHWPTPKNLRSRRAVAVLDSVVARIISERRRNNGGKDLLSMLMLARDDDGSTMSPQMTDVQLRDEVMTIFLAGHETTSNALSWIFYCLARHPSTRRRLEDELASVLQGRLPTFNDTSKLSFCQMVIKESLRLFPPVWVFARRAVADDVICGHRIPAGDLIAISAFATHRHPDFWDSPEGFDPERFLPEEEARRTKFSFFPFGGGARTCIGNGFAMLELTLVIAVLVQHFRLELVPGANIEPEPVVTLRPRHGMWMSIQRR